MDLLNKPWVLQNSCKLSLGVFLAIGGFIYVFLYSSTFSRFSFNLKRGRQILAEELVIVESFRNYSQDHPEIIKHVRNHHLFPPSTLPYKLDNYPNRTGDNRIANFVMKLLKNKTKGFFLECGANDGLFLSNSITLEVELGWTGLLVEADPQAVSKLKARHRRAWVADVCLAVLPYAHKAEMVRKNGWSPMSFVVAEALPEINISGGAKAYKTDPQDIKFTSVCFPMFSILKALNVSVVDYFSLDVEGAELAILKTFPFDQGITIKVISAEVRIKATDGFKNIMKFLKSKGYRVMKYIIAEFTHDLIFLHESVKTTLDPVHVNKWLK